MTTPVGDAIRRTIHRTLGAHHHPARSVPCPHCGAKADTPCTTRSGRRLLRDAPAHASRITAWARATKACPTCGAQPGTDCHTGGWPTTTVHDTRTAA